MTPNTETPYERRLAANKAWKSRNRNKQLAYNRNRNAEIAADPDRYAKKRRLSRESYRRNIEKHRAYDAGRDIIKVRARRRLRNLIWRGRIKRQPCEVCGNPKSHGHHEDYSKPLEVKWLCAKHHKEIHK